MFKKNIFELVRELAKTTEAQNLFYTCKELNSVRMFKNDYDLSHIQQTYISYLYLYESLAHDIIVEGISKKIYNSEIYEDAYIKWRSDKKDNKKSTEKKSNDLSLVASKKIIFPTEVKNNG